jgi:hypothetical protein
LQLLAGAILIGALGGGVMLIQHSAGADATRAKVAAAPQVAATRPPAPSPSPSPSPAPFIVPHSRPEGAAAPWRLRVGRVGPQGPVVITVDLAAQVVSIFRDGYEIGTAAIIYGADNMPTPLGVFPSWRRTPTMCPTSMMRPCPICCG